MNLKLVSFKICPFVQRSAITLIEKGIEYEITYIDIKNPPTWFLKLSPFAKVPILCVDGPCQSRSPQQMSDTDDSARQTEVELAEQARAQGAVIFESAVIMEFIDETHPPSMHPHNPLQRAHNREWIEFNSNMNLEQHSLLAAPDKAAYDKKLADVRKAFRHVAAQLHHKPFFNGESFSLIDAAYGPTLQRYKLVEPIIHTGLFAEFPAIDQWAEALLARDSIHRSVVPDFNEIYMGAVKKWGGYAATLLP